MRAFILLIISFLIPFSAKADPITVYTEEKTAIMVQSDQPIFSIKLKSNATTGFSWYLRAYDSNLLQPIKQTYEPPANKKLIGAGGYQIWTFRVKPSGFAVPMQTSIRFVYGRSWENNSQARQIVFQITTHVAH